jgi:hypothetical protein
MSEITQAQFERVIERLADNNKALHDLVDFHAEEIKRLREALLNFACLCDEGQCQDYGEDEGRIPCYRRQARAALGEGKE